jgi:hypothetical protein
VSNPHAIAAVTATLSQLLAKAASDSDLTGTHVTNAPPDIARKKDDLRRQLNLFLYQIAPNAAWRNADLPFRNGNGDLVRDPVLALNLSYLVTAYGDQDDDIDGHHLLAYAMSLVHDYSVLTRDQIRAAMIAFAGQTAVTGSDLADQIEQVKLTPVAMTPEDVFRLWSAFQTHYRLSVAYQASLVLIQRPKATKAPLPVGRADLAVRTLTRPMIDSVSPERAAAGATVVVKGRNLRGESAGVRFGSLDPIPPATIDDEQLTVPLPATLLAGVNTVRVVHDVPLGDPPMPHRGFESNVAAFVLTPAIITPPPIVASRGANLSLTVAPPVERTQRVSLLVGEQEIAIPPRPAGSAPTTTLSFPIPTTFPTGTFVLRLRVDGVESPLTSDPLTGDYAQPAVQVT